jgi:hypothetical protein
VNFPDDEAFITTGGPAMSPFEADSVQEQNHPVLANEGNDFNADEASTTSTRAVPAWLISLSIHSVIGLVFSIAVFSGPPKTIDVPPGKFGHIDPPKEKPVIVDPPIPPTEPHTPILIDTDNITKTPAPIIPVTDPITFEPTEPDEIPQGREEAVSVSELGGSGAFMAIGAGGGGGGMFGNRNSTSKSRILRRPGGPNGRSENAVDAALRWFKKHQNPNGMWDTQDYYRNCTDDGSKCEPGGAADSHGSDCNVAATAYAVRCFLGAGYDHRTPNKFRDVVTKGVEWLKSAQNQATGLIGKRNYEHAIATQALAEAYAMSNDATLREPAQRAVNYLLQKQNRDSKGGTSGGGLGWDYIEPTGRNDASVTGWCVMALKSALGAQLHVGSGLSGAREWLKRSYEISNPNHAQLTNLYTDIGDFAYCWDDKTTKVPDKHLGRTALGTLSAVFLGHRAGDQMLETMLNHVMKTQLPASYPTNTYYLYYNTLAMFQAGGERWKIWNNTVRDMLVKAQRRDGCFAGSWDVGPFIGSEVGRTISTAYCCLSLEVYYIYNRVGGDGNYAR